MAIRTGWARAALWAIGGVLALPAAAQADTIVQTVTNTYSINTTDPADGSYTPIADSFFNAVFDPFAGSDLTSAVLDYSITFTGSATSGSSGGNFSATIGGTAALNGTAFGGAGNGGGGSGAPNSTFGTSFTTTPDPEPDLLTADSGNLASLVTGTDFLFFTLTGSPTVFLYTTSGGLAAFSGTVTVTDTLTYTYTGEGALYVPMPEPASLALLAPALLGLGLVRRRRGNAAFAA